jgi:protein-S-isoprenylcysteine O-methyltransferase Ste14
LIYFIAERIDEYRYKKQGYQYFHYKTNVIVCVIRFAECYRIDACLLIGAIFIYSFNDKAYQYLVPISYLMKDVFMIVGSILIHLSLLWISVAQYQMSNSWRIGIDENNKTELITKGLFSYSRNPIFLGMIISVAGIFFILPNVLTFFLILSTYIVIQIQIRLEEEFLKKTTRTRIFIL